MTTFNKARGLTLRMASIFSVENCHLTGPAATRSAAGIPYNLWGFGLRLGTGVDVWIMNVVLKELIDVWLPVYACSITNGVHTTNVTGSSCFQFEVVVSPLSFHPQASTRVHQTTVHILFSHRVLVNKRSE